MKSFNTDLSNDDAPGCSSGILQSIAKVTQKLRFTLIYSNSVDEQSPKLSKIETMKPAVFVLLKFHPENCCKRKEIPVEKVK